MITNVYYAIFHKPYILRKDYSFASAPVLREDSPKNQNLSKPVSVYKAMNTQAALYARDFAATVSDLRIAANDIVNTLKDYSRLTEKFGDITAADMLEEDLAVFFDSFNKFENFSKFQHASSDLRDLALCARDSLSAFLKDRLITRDEDGELALNEPIFRKHILKKETELRHDLLERFEPIYEKTADFMTIPLSDHMNFKNQKYYYNYRIELLTGNPFGSIENGIIVDRVI